MTVVSDQMWSLHLEAPLGAVEAEKSIIWSSSPASLYPTSKELSQLLAVKGIEPNDLTNLAVQIVRNAPVSALPNLLNSIACHYWRNESSLIDVRMMDNLHNANHRTVCGLVFRKGDIVWMCRTCAKDPTCVQCDACFKRSDHVDHEVYFHRASGRGGCCDCGDPEAWALCGNCTEHSIVANQLEIDPLTVLPADLLKGFRAVVAGVVGVIVSYSTGTVRGLESYADNSFVFEAERINELKGKPVKLKVRLHNDDVHTYEEVILALTSFDISNSLAQAMTVAVDQEGEASIITGEVTDNRLSRASRVLGSQAGLLVSIVPDKLATIGPSVAAALSWLVSFGNSNDGLRRAVTEVFMQETESLPSCASAVPDLGVPSPNMIFVDLPAGRSNQFPNAIQHLRSNVPDRLAEDTLNKMLRCSPFTICPRNGLAILLMASPYLNPAMSKLTNDLVIVYQQDSQFKLVFSQVVTLLYPALYGLYFRSIGTAKETVFVSTVQVYTADSIVTMMSSEGVAERPLKERRDWPTNTAPVRKSKNERSLDAKRGKRETNVICRVDQPPEDPVNLMEMLTSTFLTLLADVGCTPGREDDKFASHHSIHTKRFNSKYSFLF